MKVIIDWPVWIATSIVTFLMLAGAILAILDDNPWWLLLSGLGFLLLAADA